MYRVAVGCDPNAEACKEKIMTALEQWGYEVLDMGSEDPLYANTAYRVGRAVTEGTCDRGVLICGTGLGMSIAANKVKGVRAVVCSEPYSAKLSRQHNNTNVLAFGARVVGIEVAKMIVTEWLNAEFEGERHQRRVDLIMAIENGD